MLGSSGTAGRRRNPLRQPSVGLRKGRSGLQLLELLDFCRPGRWGLNELPVGNGDLSSDHRVREFECSGSPVVSELQDLGLGLRVFGTQRGPGGVGDFLGLTAIEGVEVGL